MDRRSLIGWLWGGFILVPLFGAAVGGLLHVDLVVRTGLVVGGLSLVGLLALGIRQWVSPLN